jgi:hypothetical protein
MALDSFSSRRRRAAWTRRRAAMAYASVSLASLTMASSRARRAAASVSFDMMTARGREPTAGEQYHVNSTTTRVTVPALGTVSHDQCVHGEQSTTRVTVPALGTVSLLGLTEAEKKLRL